MSVRYSVRWTRRTGESLRIVEYNHYSQAESCFIGLLPEVERHSGGWAELMDGDRVVIRIGDERFPRDAEAEDVLAAKKAVLT